MNDRFHYDALVDDALRSVVRRVLTQVAEKGLPGSHHFYISFRSTESHTDFTMTINYTTGVVNLPGTPPPDGSNVYRPLT